MRFRADLLAAVDAEVDRRRAAGQKTDRTQLMEAACEEKYGAAVAKAKQGRNGRR